MSFAKNIEESIQEAIREVISSYVRKIVERYENTDEETLLALWEGTENPSSRKSSTQKPSSSRKSISGPKSSSETKPSSEGCPYVPTKGQKANQPCGVKPKNGSTYCSSHKKYEGQTPKEKKILPVPKKGENLICKKDKNSGKFLLIGTDLVLKSAMEKRIVGRLVNGKVEALRDDDIQKCVELSVPYDVEEEKEAGKPAKKEKGKVSKLKEESDGEEEGEGEEEKQVKGVKTVASAPKKENPKKENPKKGGKGVKAPPPKEEESDGEEEEEEEKKPVKKGKDVKPIAPKKEPKAKGAGVKALPPKEEEEEEEEKKPEKGTKKTSPKKDKRRKSEEDEDVLSTDTADLISDLGEDVQKKVVSKALGFGNDEDEEDILSDDD